MAVSAGRVKSGVAHWLIGPESRPVGGQSREGADSRTVNPSSNPRQVLLVEDDPSVADLYATVLRLHGHAVTVAGDGLAGLAAVRSGRFDIILLDIRMPRMDGLAMLRTMIGERVAPHTPVVILTNYDDSIIRQEALELGARDYLLKSRTLPQELATRLPKWLS